LVIEANHIYSLDVHEDAVEVTVHFDLVDALLPVGSVHNLMAQDHESLGQKHPVHVVILDDILGK
jgi:hypothetical protein